MVLSIESLIPPENDFLLAQQVTLCLIKTIDDAMAGQNRKTYFILGVKNEELSKVEKLDIRMIKQKKVE